MSDASHDDRKSKSAALVNENGWDGKLRVQKRAVLSEPQGLSDPEDLEDLEDSKEGAVSSEHILIDEGKVFLDRVKLAKS